MEGLDNFLETHQSVATQTAAWTNMLLKYDSALESAALAEYNNGEVVGYLPGFLIKTRWGTVYQSIPYPGGYGGIVAKDAEVYQKLFEQVLTVIDEAGCIAATIINQPWVKDYKLYEKFFKQDYCFMNFANYIDLTQELNFDDNPPRAIQKAMKSGITVIHDPTERQIRVFYDLFKQQMKHFNQAHFSYYFFLDILDKLVPREKAKFLLAELDGKIVAGILLLLHNDIVEYFHPAVHADYRKYQPISLLINEGIKWAVENNYRIWNWQSSVGRDDGTHKFKMRWGSKETEHFYFTKVFDNKIFELDMKELKSRYPFYYFLPYGALENRKERFFEK